MIVEVFFDYACPYCYRAHGGLKELAEKIPGLEFEWRPCEAHPKPEQASVHSDKAIEGMYFIRDSHADLWKYHELIYDAVFEKRLDISSPAVLSELAGACGVSVSDFRQALNEKRYAQEVIDGNLYAWGDKKLEAVPSYSAGGKTVGSGNGAPVSAERLETFLKSLM